MKNRIYRELQLPNWMQDKLYIFFFEVLQFPAQLIGYSKYIEQNVTDTKCLLNINRRLQTGNCRQQDDSTKIIVWTNPHHGTAEFRLIGR